MNVGKDSPAPVRSPRRWLTASVLLTAGVALCGALSFDAATAQPAPGAAPTSTGAGAGAVGANLNITPRRVTFDRNDRSATVTVFNQGATPTTVDIALVDRLMLPNGQIMPVAEADGKPELKAELDRVKSAREMILMTPRRAVLAPGKSQTIRLRLAAEADPNVEYRTHLTVTTVPPRDVGLTAEQAAAGSANQLRFIINSSFGLSIPLIVREGTPDVRAAIQNAHLDYANISLDGVAAPKRTPVVDFDIVRQGASSLYGNVEVTAAKGGQPLGVMRGVGVYTEIDRRTMQVPLSRAPTPGEPLEVTFTDDDTSPGKVLARTSVGS
jgi:hypothetical protein